MAGGRLLGRLWSSEPRRFAWPVRLSARAAERGLAGAAVVALRELRLQDEKAWRALRLADDARLSPWEATLPPQAGEGALDFASFVRAQERRARLGEAMSFVIEVDGALGGQLSVDPIHWGSLRSAQVGYWIGGSLEGCGIARLAVAMALDHLLGPAVGLHRVEINVRPENDRSLALCRALGLREEGLRRRYMHINGVWADHVSFAVVAEDRRGRAGFVDGLTGGQS
ncbi:Putative ribosomal N-acetyltransferase YdaF [Actinomyces slackii]|uniref:Ribosomal N-acetyltransferase YdaF n=3 Tax=Actinomyces slackii TaxID=52774 RepID=A0A3S4SSV4_9ACTO|nr:Putative ribosomal N-acetyltransferase YdaF [Actinomyces slackii]